ncbi:hypothetical protein [Nocardia asiatica]|uniref:hypothetical protein n=1 Tax=Nocardia asiatica TaxID=209252 RepID=UPI000310E484|nr:hypothetical protein [Nocardia asiatica]
MTAFEGLSNRFLVQYRDGEPCGVVDADKVIGQAKALLCKLADAGRDPAEVNRIISEVRQSVDDDDTAAAWIVGVALRLNAADARLTAAEDALRARFHEFRSAALAKRGGGR